MKSTLRFLVLALCCLAATDTLHAQVTGSINLPSATYPTLASVVTALNAQGVGAGGATINLPAGYTETAPAGGYILGSTTLNASLTVANPLVFQKSGTGANPLLTASTGGTATPASAVQDGIFALAGTDYVTISSIDLTDPNAANPATMEYGYALYKASATDGCQNNTIQNCVVTLNRINNASGTAPMTNGSCGIVLMNATQQAATTPLTITAASGTSSNNKFYGNTLQNANNGIVLVGFAAASPFTLADSGNDIGGATAATGNQVLNFGGAASATNGAAGVLLTNQWAFNISNNTINNNNGSGVNHVAILRGIYTTASTSASGTINNNALSIKNGGTTTQVSVIENAAGGTSAANTISISGNTVSNCTNELATTGTWYGIWNSASATNVNLTNNAFTGNTSKATSGATYLVYNSGSAPGTINITGNNVSHAFNNTAAYTGTLYCVYNSGGTSTSTLNMNTNTFANITHTMVGTGTTYYCYNTIGCANTTFNANNWNNITHNNSAAAYLIYNSTSTQVALNVTNNTITTGFTRTAAAGTLYCYYSGASSLGSSTQTFTGNNFSNITGATSGSGTFYGIYTSDGASSPYPRKTFANNTFNNINYNTTGTFYAIYSSYNGDGGSTTTGSTVNTNLVNNITTSGTIYGIYVTGTASPTQANNVYGNTVSNITGNSTSSFVYGMYSTGGALVNWYGNKVANISSAQTTGSAIYGMYFSTSTNTSIYNNVVSEVKAPTGNSVCPVYGMYFSGGTTYSVYHNTINLNPVSSGVNFGVSGLFYAAGITSIDLRNNIIRVNGIPAGTGFVNAVRRDGGVAGTAPGNLSLGSNGNILYAPNQANSWLYGEGTSQAQVNAFNLTNDAAFNTSCGAYKTLMAPRESSTFTENNLVQAGTTYVYAPTGTSFAKSVAVPTTPAITLDYNGNTRNSPADAGAVQFTGTAIDASGPTIVYSPFSSTTYCTVAPVLTASINDLSGVNNTSNPPRLYFRKSSDANAFGTYPGSNVSTFNGWKYVTATNTANVYSFQLDYSLLQSMPAIGETIQYFVVAQDNNATSNVSSTTIGYATGYCPTSVNILPAGGPTLASPVAAQYTILAEPAAPVISPVAAPAICPGSSVTLTAAPSSQPILADLGTGTITNGTTGYPTPFGQFYGGSHDQYLVRASELSALGITAGNINSIAFNLAAGYTYTALQNYAIKIAPTALTAQPTTFISTGFTQVYSSTSYAPNTTAGWNTIPFSAPFFWDGTSNIVIDISFLNCTTCNTTSSCTTAFSSNGSVFQSTTPFVSVMSNYADGNCTINTFTPTGSFNVATATSQRPNMRFNATKTVPLNWSPVTGLYKNAALTQVLTATDTNKVVYASPATTTSYVATNMYTGCNGAPSNTAVVTVNPAPVTTITPAGPQGLCPGTTLQLSVPAAAGTTYQWKESGVAISGATSNTYTANAAGTYTVTATITATGCSSTTAMPTVITINPVPVAAIAAAGPTTFCNPGSVTLNANTGSGYTYQ